MINVMEPDTAMGLDIVLEHQDPLKLPPKTKTILTWSRPTDIVKMTTNVTVSDIAATITVKAQHALTKIQIKLMASIILVLREMIHNQTTLIAQITVRIPGITIPNLN